MGRPYSGLALNENHHFERMLAFASLLDFVNGSFFNEIPWFDTIETPEEADDMFYAPATRIAMAVGLSDNILDVEWIMKYCIEWEQEGQTDEFKNTLEVKPSTIPDAGEGLFTTEVIDRSATVTAFPGTWLYKGCGVPI